MESSREHSPDYRVLAVFWSLAEAELARGLLVSDGISAAFGGAADLALLPGAGTTPIRLLVPAAELDQARTLLVGASSTPTPVAVDSVEAEPMRLEPVMGWSRAWIAIAVAVALSIFAALAGAL